MARGYYARYYRPYGQYARRFWRPRREVAPVVAAYPAANPMPPPGCCGGNYIK
jgi:hypothetical protein